MIKNAKQYNVSESKLKDLELSLQDCNSALFPNSNIYQATKASIQSLITDLETEMRDYEQTNANGV